MESWGEVEQSGEVKEFTVQVELYISPAAGAALPRPPNPRKKADKRESVRQVNGSIEDRRVKEKSSWLNSPKSSAGGGHWRLAICRLSEEGERCSFNIYVDNSILWSTAYIHLLSQTDIREASPSLFFRQNCLAIHCANGKRWAPSLTTEESIYLKFDSPNVFNTWLALLRSYALPEIYGRWFFPSEGGSYRMWRQVDLNIKQGRNIGSSKPFELDDDEDDGNESTSEPDPVDLDVFCEILLNETLCARTTVKKGIGSPEWHEGFMLSDLPPFESLDILVWQQKKLFKPYLLGTVRLSLNIFCRGELVEGWYPVLQAGSIASDTIVGEIRLQIRVDEEIILPYSAYSKLLKTFNNRNFPDWMFDLETKFKLKTIAPQLMSIAIANNTLVEQVQVLANREVDGSQSPTTLFRGNTILTRIMELCMTWYGKAFLEASIGKVVRRLIIAKVTIEVDPMRTAKGAKDVEKNVDLLIYWCQEVWEQIYSVREQCPPEMRRLFCTIRELVEERFTKSESVLQDKRDLRWQGVSAFCFLRFLVPGILHPHLFQLYPGLPSPPVQRSLTLIAKVIQSLANLNSHSQKEEFMRGVKDFLASKVPEMISYITVVSTPGDGLKMDKGSDRLDRPNIVNALRIRASSMPVLYKESIPLLSHTLDIPRELAILTSAVIRHSRPYFAEAQPNPQDKDLQDFCARCFEVEEQALHRVTQLAAQLSANQQRRRFSPSPVSPTSGINHSPTPLSPSGRPSTAPGGESNRRRLLSESTNVPEVVGPGPSQSRNRLLHFKSTSTDSMRSHFNRESSASVFVSTLRTTESSIDIDDPKRKKGGLLRGIWRR